MLALRRGRLRAPVKTVPPCTLGGLGHGRMHVRTLVRTRTAPIRIAEVIMLSAFLVWSVLSFASLHKAGSLWENPPDGRPTRQRRAGVCHRLLAELCYWWFRLFALACRCVFWLHKHAGLPVWVVNHAPCLVMPFKAARVVGAQEYLRRHHSDVGGAS